MDLNFKTIDITLPEDWKELEREWKEYMEEEHNFEHYRHLLSELNFIVGFGRGFWAGVHSYSYLTYHKKNDKFYWFLRDIESDRDVFFYEVDNSNEFFDLLNTKSISKDFDYFDDALDYNLLSKLMNGKVPMECPYKPVTLTDVFGEDTVELRDILMMFSPASLGSTYPHKEFENRFFAPKLRNEKISLVKDLNASKKQIFFEDDKIVMEIDDKRFELVPLEDE